MEGRDPAERVVATRMITGADVNYGALTRNLVRYLRSLEGFAVHYSQHVTGLAREPGGRWRLDVKDAGSGARRSVPAGARCHCCRSQGFRKVGAMADFR